MVWCFCGGVGVVFFFCGVGVVVFFVVVLVWWCFCGAVFVVVWWCAGWSVVGKCCREVL